MRAVPFVLKMSGIIGAALLASSVQAADEWRNSDTLLGVVQEALDENPELRFRSDIYTTAQHERREVVGGYLPSVDLSTSVGQANREFDRRGGYSRNYAEVSVTQMLFDGFLVRNRLARADHNVLARYYDLLNEAETKALEVGEAYLDVLRYREMVALAQVNLGNHQRVQEQIEQRAQRGVSNRADLQQINGRLSLARSNLVTEVANLQTVTARFQRLVGRTPAQNLAPFDLSAGLVPADLSGVLRQGFANNPALYAAFEEIRAAESSVGEAKSGRYPRVELAARHGVYKNNNSFDNRTDPDSYGNESIVELRMRYNLYRGGSDRAAERAAYSRVNQAESLRDKACVDLRQTATIAWADIVNLQEKLGSLQAHRDESANVLVAYRDQFDIGRRSLLDVLDSENEAFQSERAYAAGQYELLNARLRALHSMGSLLQTLALPDHPVAALGDVASDYAVPGNSSYCQTEDNGVWGIDQYLQPVRDSREQRLDLSGDALFDVGSAEIKTGSVQRLSNFLQGLTAQGQVRFIEIIGHTDSTGSDSLNRALSQARAEAVRDFLVSEGVDAAAISVSGVGAAQPVADNGTVQGRAENRRVELRVHRD